jgi:hypothetical protein
MSLPADSPEGMDHAVFVGLNVEETATVEEGAGGIRFRRGL